MEHISRFTVQYDELANYDNFDNLLLRLFLTSLIRAAFTWYFTLPRNSINILWKMEWLFYTPFFRAKLEMSMVELSRLVWKVRETIDAYLTWFKTLRNRCRIYLLEVELIKVAQ